MARPSKPLEVIKAEGKSHRTKAELKVREKNEKAVLSGIGIAEEQEVKNNPIAHDRFIRTCEILGNIKKLDAIYEVVINRYCLLYAETVNLAAERKRLMELIEETKVAFDKEKEILEDYQKATISQKFVKNLQICLASITKIDETLIKKRKMLLDIEKENVMTIASALRSIPKTPEQANSGPSLKDILRG